MSFLLAHLALPATVLLVAVFGADFSSHSVHVPQSAAGTVFLLVFLTSLAAIIGTSISCKPRGFFKDTSLDGELVQTLYWEVSQGIYNAVLLVLSYLLLSSAFDLVSVIMASSAFVW